MQLELLSLLVREGLVEGSDGRTLERAGEDIESTSCRGGWDAKGGIWQVVEEAVGNEGGGGWFGRVDGHGDLGCRVEGGYVFVVDDGWTCECSSRWRSSWK